MARLDLDVGLNRSYGYWDKFRRGKSCNVTWLLRH